MAVGLLTLHLHIPEVRSLKDKRSAVKSLKERLRQRFNVAVAEVEHHKLHARATLAVVTVAESDYRCREVLEQVLRYTWQPGPAQLTHHEMEWLH